MNLPGFCRDQNGKPIIGLDDESIYAWGDLVRRTESLILSLFSKGLLSGTTHTCLGQEICQMSVVRALSDPDDVVLSNHRNHGHFLTYSGDVLGLVTEIMGRSSGTCFGYGGSQHISYRGFHSNGVQAGMTGIGVGLGLARKFNGSNALVAVMIGDGTLGEGLLYESMNLASIWRAPVLYVVENNGIAQTTMTENTIGGSIAGRGKAFGLEVWELDDSDPQFCDSVQKVVDELRADPRPGMLVINTMRLGPHSKGDDLRSEQEKSYIQKRDPLSVLGERLEAKLKAEIDARNGGFIKELEQAAIATPESQFAGIPAHSFKAGNEPASSQLSAEAENVRASINAGLDYLLAQNKNCIVLGEDLHEPYGGAFKVTAGLSEKYQGRVISTPISEAGITGAGIGLALAGFRPIVEIMFADFLTLCADQLFNHAVKFPAMFEDVEVPLIIRTPCGGRRGYGPTHSQSPENIFTSIPGLTVVFGSHRHNVGQLLVDLSQNWPNPALFLEHKLLYGEKQSTGAYQVLKASDLDMAATLFPTLVEGSQTPDLTVITYGGMLPIVEEAIQFLRETEELEVEVMVPSLLAPLPRNTLMKQLLNRPAIAVVEESHHEYGVGAELLAMLLEAGYQGEAIRVGTDPVPIPAARSLERQVLPDKELIIANLLELF